ncbi:bifunctional phosphopantothenoylcysteine decarboxylase/phosphopantothenate--cysteine ligase CoaBC [Alphaproteobacteria bacterium]|nr:bifunctional phosphopantothenoylcysteine decarboxylase/phosphopantothenate--cysteine ligase CoaBC [Alphaproteobacteria bacterium]
MLKKILFIITGSIAVSRCYDILKILKKNKIEIDCIITNNAKKLLDISKLKKSTLGKIYTDKSENNKKMLHISLSRTNNMIVVCPATANTIGKFANGYGDNLASTTLLASNKPVILIPAMNTMMWNNSINTKNINYLKSIGVDFIGPKIGKLKCGEYGLGRIEETKYIVNNIISKLKKNQNFINKKCLITAGPTLENIDPIRYISNYSSGKQGYEIANQLSKSGAEVILISGPTNLQTPTNIKVIKVKTADEMFNQVKKYNKKIDVAIFSAAVADFKIKKINSKKIKKNNLKFLNLIKNTDILKTISSQKYNRPKLVVGFSAETEGKISAKKKLKEKNCDMIVYNKISKNNKVFGLNENKISILTKYKVKNYVKTSKINCAKHIIDSIYTEIKN